MLIAYNYISKEQSREMAKGIRLDFQTSHFANTKLKYSLSDESNTIIEIGLTEADSKGLVTISGCHFFKTAYVQFYYEGKEVTHLVSKPPLKHLKYDYAHFLTRLPLVWWDNYKNKNIAGFENINDDGIEKTLPEVKVNSVKPNRIQQLESKYIRNGMFHDLNAKSIDVESDFAASTYSFFSYLERHIPGLLKRRIKVNGILSDVLTYRGGFLEYYIDEMPIIIENMGNNYIDLRDIGYIRFYPNPISSGMSSQKAGQALPGGTGYTGGIQGSVAIYTRKYSEEKAGNKPKGIEVRGYENLP